MKYLKVNFYGSNRNQVKAIEFLLNVDLWKPMLSCLFQKQLIEVTVSVHFADLVKALIG